MKKIYGYYWNNKKYCCCSSMPLPLLLFKKFQFLWANKRRAKQSSKQLKLKLKPIKSKQTIANNINNNNNNNNKYCSQMVN